MGCYQILSKRPDIISHSSDYDLDYSNRLLVYLVISHIYPQIFYWDEKLEVRRYVVISSFPSLQSCGPGSSPGEVRTFNFYPWTVCVCPLCSVLCCRWWWPRYCADHAFRGARPSVSVFCSDPQSLAPLQSSDPCAFGLQVPGALSRTSGEVH